MACAKIGWPPIPDTEITEPFHTYGWFRSNPLPGALASAAKEEETLGNLEEYVWTLYPYFIFPLLICFLIALSCPACVVFVYASKSMRRPPFRHDAGLAFHIFFALMGLIIVLASLVAVEGEVRADRSYYRAKCSIFLGLDYLRNGTRHAVPGPRVPGFVGFEPLAVLARATTSTLKNLREEVSAMKASMPNDTQSSFAVLGPGYLRQWADVQLDRMRATEFHCTPCAPESLMPLASVIKRYSHGKRTIETSLDGAKLFLANVEAALVQLHKRTQRDVSVLSVAVQSLSTTFLAYDSKLEKVLHRARRGIRVLALLSITSLAFGMVSLSLLRGSEGCAFISWWSAYLVTAGAFPLSAILLPSAVVLRDVASLLDSAMLSDDAFNSFNATQPLRHLSVKQRKALSTCFNLDENVELRNVIDIDIGDKEAQSAKELVEKLRQLRELSLPRKRAEIFFAKYENLDGKAYTAKWNSSQTLGENALLYLSLELKRLSTESWTFFRHEAPPDCVLARDFNPNVDVYSTNCWLVSEVRPTQDEVKERYFTLSPAQLQKLQIIFARARASAEALSSVYAMVNEAPKVHKSWVAAADALDRSLRIVTERVSGPLLNLSEIIIQANGNTNCSVARAAAKIGTESLGQDLVRSQVILWVCVSLVAISNLGLTVLNCFLWSLRQSGKTSRPVFPGKAHFHGQGSDNDESQGGWNLDQNEDERTALLR